MLQQLELANFRSYAKKSFSFGAGTTLIVGPNASGKTNILEAIYCLATGKSFRAEKETELISELREFSRIGGAIENEIRDIRFKTQAKKQEGGDSLQGESLQKQSGSRKLEIIWDQRPSFAKASEGRSRFQKLYRVNGVGKRMVDFVGNLRVVLFCPQDIEIVAGSPSTRRRYLDSVLSLVHRDYRVAISIYERALRQRNRLLWKVRELGINRNSSEFDYWDNLLVNNGKIIHEQRREYLGFLSNLGDLRLDYDHSIVSAERLREYAGEEIAAATTLVGPQRDDFVVRIRGNRERSEQSRNAKAFGSRGEQRLAVFTIKLGELEYVRQQATGNRPILLLDDIFSELDHENRHHILKVIPKQQTIMTTTDLHLVEKAAVKGFDLVELG